MLQCIATAHKGLSPTFVSVGYFFAGTEFAGVRRLAVSNQSRCLAFLGFRLGVSMHPSRYEAAKSVDVATPLQRGRSA